MAKEQERARREQEQQAAPMKRRQQADSASDEAEASPTSQSRPAGEDSEFTPGMHVRIVGLQSAREHNGKEGVLIAPVATASGTRWNLRLKSGELLALKPSNLEALESGPSMQKMIDALERAGEIDKAAMLRSVLPDADA